MRNIVLLALLSHSLAAQSSLKIRQAVDRALPPLEHSTATFVAKRACVSCHHNILSILMFQMARERGVNFDPAVLERCRGEDVSFASRSVGFRRCGAGRDAQRSDPRR